MNGANTSSISAPLSATMSLSARVHDRVDDDRPHAGLRVGVSDARSGAVRLLVVVDERDAERVEVDAVELRQHAVADRLGGDAGAVGDVEDRSAHDRVPLLLRHRKCTRTQPSGKRTLVSPCTNPENWPLRADVLQSCALPRISNQAGSCRAALLAASADDSQLSGDSLERSGALARSAAHVRSRQGRRQERLARRDDRQSRQARRLGAGRLRDHGGRVPAVHRAERPGRAHPRAPRDARRRRRRCADRRPARRFAAGSSRRR